jgi:pyruvate carboxylase
VFEEYRDFVLKYSDLIEKLPTRAFLTPLAEDEELEIELGRVSNSTTEGRGAGTCFGALEMGMGMG